ncbi:MAG: hypothetical protein ACYC5H_13655 [Methylovirgula sp.]
MNCPKKEFVDWSYRKAREELWPFDEFRKISEPRKSEIEWLKPPAHLWRPIDVEIEKLLECADGRSARLSPDICAFGRKGGGIDALRRNLTVGFLSEYGQLEAPSAFQPFCPFKEMRGHWIPFALQVASFQVNEGDLRMRMGSRQNEKLCSSASSRISSKNWKLMGRPLSVRAH